MTVPIISNLECSEGILEALRNSEFNEVTEEVVDDGSNSESYEVTEKYEVTEEVVECGNNSESYEVPEEVVWDGLICISTEGGSGICGVSYFTIDI